MSDDHRDSTRTTAGGVVDGLEDRASLGSDRRRDPYYPDEISLRELYLILKRGLPLIGVIAVLAAAMGFIWVALQPNTYRAEATVLNTPPAVRIQEPSVREGDTQNGTFAFEPTNTVTFETYRAIASSQAVLHAVTTVLGAETALSSSNLRAATEVERLSGPANPSQVAPLTVLHIVEWGDPDDAVRIANAWAEATVTSLRASLLESLEPIRETTAATVAVRRAALDEAVQAWREFESRDGAVSFQASLDGLTSAMTQVERRLSELGTLVSVARVRVQVLEEQLDELGTSVASADPISEGYLAGLGMAAARERIAQELAAAETARNDARLALDAFERESDLWSIASELRFLIGSPLLGSGNASGIAWTRDARPILGAPSGASLMEAPSVIILDADGGAIFDLRRELHELARQIAAEEARLTAGAGNEVELAALHATQRELEQQLTEAESRAISLHASWLDLSLERDRLVGDYQLAEERYRNVRSRALSFAPANSGDGVLRDTSLEASALRAEHRAASTRLAELEAEQSARSEQMNTIRTDTEPIRTELSRLDRERTELSQDLEQASDAYRSVAKLLPTIEYLTELAPSGVRVINRAAGAQGPTGPSTLLVTLLTLLIGGFGGTLFVFLREAVRE